MFMYLMDGASGGLELVPYDQELERYLSVGFTDSSGAAIGAVKCSTTEFS